MLIAQLSRLSGAAWVGDGADVRASAAVVSKAAAANRIDRFMLGSCPAANGGKLNVAVEKSPLAFDFALRPS